MNAKKCDVCLEFYIPTTGNNYYFIGKRIAKNDEDAVKLDLCPNCYKKLDKWVNRTHCQDQKIAKPVAETKKEEDSEDDLPF